MKTNFILCLLLGILLVIPEADARGNRGGGARGGGHGGGGHSKSFSHRSSGGDRRSPTTNTRISRPKSRPESRPQQRPQTRPAPEKRPSVQRPSTQRPSVERPSVQRPSRPDTGNAKIPDRKPDIQRPGNSRPDNRPSLERPDHARPTTLPGMVTYPNRPDKPRPDRPGQGGDNRPGFGGNNRPGDHDRPGNNNRPDFGGNNRPGKDRPSIVDRDRDRNNFGDRNNVHIDKINVGRKNIGLNRPATLPADRRHWDSNRWGGNNSVWGNRVNIGNDVNIKIDNRFRHNNNFAMRPDYWGPRPWWGAGNYHDWHHGCWGYGWNSHYYHHHWWFDDDDFASGFMWGIGVWSLGNLIYDMGYQSYRNPYPAPPVQNTYITYAEPVSVAAAANPPGDEETSATAEAKSDDALEISRGAFKKGDYVGALKSLDEAISYTPGDLTLHEYRSLVFFALGKYGDAAGVLNPVLASGPGWTWDTMIGFYDGSTAYNEQLGKLEDYVKSGGKAESHFLLGYHYMVCGYMDKANVQFAKAAELQPADTISVQLRDLTANSIPDAGDTDAPPPPAPDPVDSAKLPGTWSSDGAGGKVTFTMTEAGDFTWKFDGNGKSTELKGTYGVNDKGLLVLTTDDTQMVSAVTIDGPKMQFTLVGAPDGDPGLSFTKG